MDAVADQGALFEMRPVAPRSLVERFTIPPLTVLDRRQGYWQDRRRSWLSLGIQPEVGRDEGLTFGAGLAFNEEGKGHTRTSVFDPVLTEACIRWFCPRGGMVLDPFAGGSVRGVVAAACERDYFGIDLRDVQVAANQVQARTILAGTDWQVPLGEPQWIAGDSAQVLDWVDDTPPLVPDADLILTCPPYHDLEVYSDDPHDLSAMTYNAFRDALTHIVARAVDRLKPNGFAAVVIGDVRDKHGRFKWLVGDVIDAFRATALDLWNQAVILDPPGSAAVRAAKQFTTSRKLVMTHQHLLVFHGGDGREATATIMASDEGAVTDAVHS